MVSLLQAAGHEVVRQVGDGQKAVEATVQHQPDLVLMDISMPTLSGIEALRAIKQQLATTKVVMLTVSEEDKDLMAAVEAGADGYLHKNLGGEEFLEMLKGVTRGEAAMTRSTAARLMRRLSQPEPLQPAGHPLTERESELLGLLAEGMSNRQIARHLSISENTVKFHVKNIFHKLAVSNRAEAVAVGIRQGLLEPTTPTNTDAESPR